MKNSKQFQETALRILKNYVTVFLLFISYSSFGQSGPSFSLEKEENSYQIKTEVQPNNSGNVSVSSKLWYGSDNSIIKSIRYYNEQSLPPYIASQIHKKFKDQKIYGVTEESSESGINYLIILEDEKSWYHVISNANGELILKTKLKKA